MISMASNAGSGACTDRSATIIAMPAKPVAANDAAGLSALLTGFDGSGRSLAAGESLFLQGDDVRSIHLLRSGWAFRSQCLENGRRQVVDFVLPGEVLGIDMTGPAPYAVETLTHCSWRLVSRANFLAHLARQPASFMTLVEMLAAGQLRAFDQMTSIGRQTARERVTRFLLILARRAQKPVPGSDGEITMPLMLSHRADTLGLTAETVCRCLATLKRASIVAFAAGRLTILDLDRLARVARPPAEGDARLMQRRAQVT